MGILAEDLKKLSAKVEYILHLHPQARNDDKYLYILLIKEFFSKFIVHRKTNGREYIALDRLVQLPSAGDVQRHRAYFQNKHGKYLPTDIGVHIRRLRNAPEEYKEALGYV